MPRKDQGAAGQSHWVERWAELVRAAESAAKRAILDGSAVVSTAGVASALDERRAAHHD